MKRFLLTSVSIIVILLLSQCQLLDQQDGEDPTDTTATLTAISPSARVSHGPSFTLTASGENFQPGSVIVFNGTDQETTYVSATELTCQIDSEQIISGSTSSSASSGLSINQEDNAETLPVLVRLPGGDEETGSVDFSLWESHWFEAAVNVFDSDYGARYPVVAVDSDGAINVVWQDGEPGSHEIYFSRSTNHGTTWTTPLVLISGGDFRRPGIALDTSGNINVVWYDNDDNAREIYYRRSTDDGNTWSQPSNISGTIRSSFDPSIAIDNSDNIYVAWSDDTPGKWAIAFSRSVNDGVTWSPAVNLSNMLGDSSQPAIAADSTGNLSVVWANQTYSSFDLYFCYSPDQGSTWTQARHIAHLNGYVVPARIVVDSSGVTYVVFADAPGNTSNIYFMRSTDNGATWEAPLNISDIQGLAETYWGPTLAIDAADNLNVSWVGTYNSQETLYFIRSIDSGITWSSVSIHTGFYSVVDGHAAIDTAGSLHLVGVNYIASDQTTQLYYAGPGSSD